MAVMDVVISTRTEMTVAVRAMSEVVRDGKGKAAGNSAAEMEIESGLAA